MVESPLVKEIEMWWKPGCITPRPHLSSWSLGLFCFVFRVAGIILDPRYAVGQVRIPTRGRMYLEDDGERGGAPCSATGGSEWS